MSRLFAASVLIAVGITLLPSTLRADLIDVLWTGPSGGNWHVTSNWDPAVVPNNGGGNLYHPFIQFTGQVNLAPSDASISSLTIGAGSVLSINNARTLAIFNDAPGQGMVNNSGTISVDSTGSTTVLRLFNGPVTLTGGGEVILNHSSAWIRGSDTGTSLVNMDNTIRGRGNLSSTTTSLRLESITNHHEIIADDSTPLAINASITEVTNTGVMRAENGGVLQLTPGPYTNTGGVIEALDNSQVQLTGTLLITGGEILTTLGPNGGMIRPTGGSPRLSDLTLNGHLQLDNSRSANLTDVIVDGGLITLNSTGSTTVLSPHGGTLTLAGGTMLELSDNSNNIIRSTSGFLGDVINLDGTIRGSGQISSPTTSLRLFSFTNSANGTIITDGASPLTIHTMIGPFLNEGSMIAQDGGRLVLSGGSFINNATIDAEVDSIVELDSVDLDNDGGSIWGDAGSEIRLAGSLVLTGGELRSVNNTRATPGAIRVTSGSPRIVDATVQGDFIVNNSNDLRFEGVFMDEKTNILINSTGSTTTLQLTNGSVEFTGGGTITLTHPSSHIRGVSSVGGTLVNVENTIRGEGNLSSTTTSLSLAGIENHAAGLIIADGASPLIINANLTPVTNEGVMRAQDGATLRLAPGTYTNHGGIIEALAGSKVELTGSALMTGGEIHAEGGANPGMIEVASNTPRLTDLTIAGHVFMPNSRNLQIVGTIENTGTIELGSTGSTTVLQPINGIVTLTGGGEVIMSDGSNNHIRTSSSSGETLINVDNTIRGAGNLSSTTTSLSIDIINQGTIIADAANNALSINGISATTILNDETGLIEITGAGGMTSTGGTFTNAGRIVVDEDRSFSRTGSVTQIAGPMSETRVDGTLAVSGSLHVQGGLLNGTGQVSGAVNNTGGTVDPGNSLGLLTIAGNYTQSGAGRLRVEVEGLLPEDEHDVLLVTADAQLGGRLMPIIDDGFTPTVGDTFEVLTAAQRSGTFGIVHPCEAIRVVYEPDAVIVEYTGTVKLGDFNCDGVVDALDMLTLLGGWGDCADPADCPIDLNGDGAVNALDLLILLGNWG